MLGHCMREHVARNRIREERDNVVERTFCYKFRSTAQPLVLWFPGASLAAM